MTFVLTPGKQHEMFAFQPLMEKGAINRPGETDPKQRPTRVVGDRGYSFETLRRYLRRRSVRRTIPRRYDQRHGGPFEKVIY